MTESDPVTARAHSLVGRPLKGKWRLESLLGVGGMAAVYSARHRNGKRVAIKILHRELAADERMRARFLREGYVANKVGHPGVVTILDDDTDDEDGSVFLVMELLEGETLKERWVRCDRRLPLREVLQMTNDVLDVLAAAHDQAIIHRDVKPANIFLTQTGETKVLDFGIARLREGPTGTGLTTRVGATLGSPSFMSPEQARARWEFVDVRTDLWAMGAVMFTMLSGEHVHEGKMGSELLIATATQTARPLRDLMPDIPDVVAAIVDRSLAFERTDRWQDARAMQAAVRRAMKIDFEKMNQTRISVPDLSIVDPVTTLRQLPHITFTDTSAPSAIESPPTSPPSALSDEPSRTMGTSLLPTLPLTIPTGETTNSPTESPSEPPPPPVKQSSFSRTILLAVSIALGMAVGGGVFGWIVRPKPVAVPAPAVTGEPQATSVESSASAASSAAAPPTAEPSATAPQASAEPATSASAAPSASASVKPKKPKKPPTKKPWEKYQPKTL